MKTILKILLHFFLFIILTLTTQIGGVVYLLSLFIVRRSKINYKFSLVLIFIPLYLVTTFIITPNIAPLFGREKVKHSSKINPTNYSTVLMNRNYVHPELNTLLEKTVADLNGIEIHYLDANFPFIYKFPLLPHLSHNDGKKIDLSLIYETPKGIISAKQKSITGYGVFENPKLNEPNQIKKCIEKGFFQYDYPKYLTLGKINSNLVFSTKGTRKLIQQLLKNSSLGKLFIEPHLKERLQLNHYKIRYHGCRAVRHDDHIHIQLK